jgi:hypothetical protein
VWKRKNRSSIKWSIQKPVWGDGESFSKANDVWIYWEAAAEGGGSGDCYWWVGNWVNMSDCRAVWCGCRSSQPPHPHQPALERPHLDSWRDQLPELLLIGLDTTGWSVIWCIMNDAAERLVIGQQMRLK